MHKDTLFARMTIIGQTALVDDALAVDVTKSPIGADVFIPLHAEINPAFSIEEENPQTKLDADTSEAVAIL
jgi:hypothetical protein